MPRSSTAKAPKGRYKTAQGNALGNAAPEAQNPERAGHLPDSWRLLPLGKIGYWFGGGTPSKANPSFWTNGTIPWVSPKDMKTDRIRDAQDHITTEAVANSATSLVPAGSVLLVVRSGILKHTLPVAVTEREVSLNQDLKAVTPSEDILPEYLALGLKAFEREILHRCCKSGTTVQNLEMPVFLRFELPVARLPDQRRIVAEIEKQFTRLEAGVAALRRVQANLKRYRAAVLKAACEGRLVPTEAELARAEGRSFESGQQLLARILTERRQNWLVQRSLGKGGQGRGKYKEPEMPDTKPLAKPPEGWAWATPEQLSSSESYSLGIGPFGSNLKVSDYTTEGVPLIFVRNIRPGRFVKAKEVYVTAAKAEELKAHQASGGDILITKMGAPPGDACLYPEDAPNAVITADCIKLRPSPLLSDRRFFVHALNSELVKPQILDITKGVAQMKVSLGRFECIAIPLPPLAEQTRIVAEVERRLSVVEELEAVVTTNLQRATRLRQSILQMSFQTGVASGGGERSDA